MERINSLIFHSLKESEYRYLVGNIDEMIEIHSALNTDLVDTSKKSPREQRLGRVFLLHGSGIRNCHQTYWANHPRAVCVLEKHRDTLDKFMECRPP